MLKKAHTFEVTLLKGYKKKNKVRNNILQWITVGAIVMSLIIVFLLFGKYQSDKLKNEYCDRKTVSTYIEGGTAVIKQDLQKRIYVGTVGEEKEVGKLLDGMDLLSGCVYLDQEAYEKMISPTFLKQYGSYPKNSNEIMLPLKVLENLNIKNPKIGMKIYLNFYWNDIFIEEMTGKQEFVLSGYYENYDSEVIDSSIAYIAKERMELVGIKSYPCRLLIDTNIFITSGERIASKLNKDIRLEDKQRVISFDSASYRAIEGIVGNCALAGIFLLLILFCIFFIVYNILYLSLANDIRQYGLLRSIGVTSKEIEKLIYRQIWSIYWISSLIGSIISLVIIKLCLSKVIEKIYLGKYKPNEHFEIINLGLLIVVLVLVGITLLAATRRLVHKLTILTPIEAIKYDESEKRMLENPLTLQRKKNLLKKRSMSFRLALYNVLRCKKKYIISIVSLGIGCEIALFSGIITSGTSQMNRLKENPDFTIEVQANKFPYLVENTNEKISFLSQSHIDRVKNLINSQVENINITRVLFPIVKGEFKENSLEILEHDSLPLIVTLDSKNMEYLFGYIQKENILINKKKFIEEDGVLILHENLMPNVYKELAVQNIGEVIEMYDLVPVGTEMQDLPTIQLINCGYVDIGQKEVANLDIPWRDNQKAYLLVSEQTFNSLSTSMEVQNIKFTINVKKEKESICKEKLKQWVQIENQRIQLEEGNSNSELYSIRCNSDEIAKESLYIKTSQNIMYTISAIFLLMGLINYFSTITTNITLRKREFALVESIGMTKKGIKKMLIYEGLIYAGGIIIFLLSIGNIIMAGVTYFIKKSTAYFVFKYPITIMAVIIGGMFVICILAPQIISKKLTRDALIERIKN